MIRRCYSTPLAKPLQMEQLRAAVALAKGADVIRVAHHRRREGGEIVARQALETLLGEDAAVDVGHACFDVAAKHEPMIALGDSDETDFAGPVVNILEQTAVDGAQVIEVEIAAGNPMRGAVGREESFGFLQRSGVFQSELVSQNACSATNIGIARHSAASGVVKGWNDDSMWARRRSCSHSSFSNISNIATSSGFGGLPSISCKCRISTLRSRAAWSIGKVFSEGLFCMAEG
jgi:hypothetical protein